MVTRECNPKTGETETRGSLRLVGQFSRLYEVSLMSGPASETKRMVKLLGSTWVCTRMHVYLHTHVSTYRHK